jgi:hypothetical protein
MKRYALSLQALNNLAAAKLSQSNVHLQDVAVQPAQYVVSRRHLLGIASVASAAAAPMASALGRAFADTYQVVRSKNRIAFWVAGVERWAVDTRHYHGAPQLIVSEQQEAITIELRQALYPSTTLDASFVARIEHQSKSICFTMTSWKSQARAEFIPWLLEKAQLVSPCQQTSFDGYGTAVTAAEGDASFHCSNMVVVRAFTRFQNPVTQNHTLEAHQWSIVAAGAERATITRRKPELRSVITMYRGDAAWHVPIHFGQMSEWDFQTTEHTFSALTMEVSSEHITGFFESAHSTITTAGLRPAHTTDTLPLRSPRYGFSLTNAEQHRAFVARFGLTPTWIHVDGVGLQLADVEGATPFEIEEQNGRLVRCVVAPALAQYMIPTCGGISSAVPLDNRHQLAFIDPSLGSGVFPEPRFFLARLQLGKNEMSISGSQLGTLPNNGIVQQKAKETITARKSLNKQFVDKLVLAGNPKIHIVRPTDLAVFTIEFKNITLNRAAGTFTPQSTNARFIVHLQPQHIAERAFYYTDSQPQGSGGSNEPRLDPPIDAIMANPSRLVFRLPNGYQGQLTTEGLLDWSNFTPAVSPLAKPAPSKFVLSEVATSVLAKSSGISFADGGGKNAKPTKYNNKTIVRSPAAVNASASKKLIGAEQTQAFGNIADTHVDFNNAFTESLVSDYLATIAEAAPTIRIPLDDETVIEYPYRLYLSPNKYSAWAHSTKPVVSNDGTKAELWHTRLGVKHSDGTVNEQATYFRTVRAIWSPDYGTNRTMPAKTVERPFRTSLNRRDRSEIVSLTSDYSLQTKALPIPVRRMMLTSLGAWMDAVGAWDPVDSDNLAVESWVQRGAQGRDSFVRVCYKGYLFPFGHRATLVKETERKFMRTPRGDMAAYLMQRKFIILREPVRMYPADGLPGMKFQGRNFPFRKVEITTKQTPNLNLPTPLGTPGFSPNSFWPMFTNNGTTQDVQWACEATDWDNQKTTFTLPLTFIEGPDAGSNDSPAKLSTFISSVYMSNANVARRTIKSNGQVVAFAPSTKLGDTSLPTTSIVLEPYSSDQIPINTPRFFPAMKKATARIEKVAELVGGDGTRDVELYSKYLEHAFEKGADVAKGANVALNQVKNPSQIFLRLLNSMPMDFGSQSDKSGGLAAPSIDISGLSRLTGPIAGDLTNIVNSAAALGNFDPMEYFAGILESKILGDITLKDILDFVMSVLNNLDKMPGLDKKDDFGMGNSKAEIENKIGEITAAADELKNGINNEVKAAKDELKNVVNDIKNSDAYKFFDATKKDAQNQINKWKKDIENKVNELKSEVDKAIKPLKDAGNEAYKVYQDAQGLLNTLKQGLSLVYEWSTEIKTSPGNILVPLHPGTTDDSKKATLYLKAAIIKKLDLNPPEFEIYGCLSNFIVNLIGDGAAQFLIIKFNKISFSSKNGSKPDVDPDIEAVEFAGPLKFVNKLKDLIPSGGSAGGVGFSFDFDVSPKGVVASLTIGLPNITVGVFSLMNMSFLLSVTIPFDGRPLSLYLAFCTKDNPFRLTIMVFGGGGFFGIEITPSGVRMLEAAFEFGGNFAFDCGVASGGASVMAGVYYKLETKEIDGNQVEYSELTGYFRLTGNLSILGIIRVSLLFELKLTWQSNGKVFGVATIEVEIEILFLSFSVGVTVERQLKGSDGDPTFTDMLPLPSMWLEYCDAFA